MTSLKPFCLTAIALLTAFLAGCGSMSNSMTSNRVLQSMTISPASADAQNFTYGQVTFSATGVFSQPPSPAAVPFVAPYSGSWSVSNTNIATIDQNGMAQCVPGANGTVKVEAIASANSTTVPGQMSIGVNATATLTCP